MTRGMQLRHSFNASKKELKEKLFEPEQADEPEAILPRSKHFEVGQQEATIHSLKDQRIKRNIRAGDESVERMINMDDPTKD